MTHSRMAEATSATVRQPSSAAAPSSASPADPASIASTSTTRRRDLMKSFVCASYFPSCDARNPRSPSGPCRSTCRELRDSGCAGMAALDCESDTCCGGHCFSDDEATCTRY